MAPMAVRVSVRVGWRRATLSHVYSDGSTIFRIQTVSKLREDNNTQLPQCLFREWTFKELGWSPMAIYSWPVFTVNRNIDKRSKHCMITPAYCAYVIIHMDRHMDVYIYIIYNNADHMVHPLYLEYLGTCCMHFEHRIKETPNIQSKDGLHFWLATGLSCSVQAWSDILDVESKALPRDMVG